MEHRAGGLPEGALARDLFHPATGSGGLLKNFETPVPHGMARLLGASGPQAGKGEEDPPRGGVAYGGREGEVGGGMLYGGWWCGVSRAPGPSPWTRAAISG